MIRKFMTVMMLLFAVATVAGCTSSPEDRGDVTGRGEASTSRTE